MVSTTVGKYTLTVYPIYSAYWYSVWMSKDQIRQACDKRAHQPNLFIYVNTVQIYQLE